MFCVLRESYNPIFIKRNFKNIFIKTLTHALNNNITSLIKLLTKNLCKSKNTKTKQISK